MLVAVDKVTHAQLLDSVTDLPAGARFVGSISGDASTTAAISRTVGDMGENFCATGFGVVKDMSVLQQFGPVDVCVLLDKNGAPLIGKDGLPPPHRCVKGAHSFTHSIQSKTRTISTASDLTRSSAQSNAKFKHVLAAGGVLLAHDPANPSVLYMAPVSMAMVLAGGDTGVDHVRSSDRFFPLASAEDVETASAHLAQLLKQTDVVPFAELFRFLPLALFKGVLAEAVVLHWFEKGIQAPARGGLVDLRYVCGGSESGADLIISAEQLFLANHPPLPYSSTLTSSAAATSVARSAWCSGPWAPTTATPSRSSSTCPRAPSWAPTAW